MPHFFGNSFPKLKLVTKLYCCTSSRLLSFGPSSKAPKPMVLILPVADTVAKSAILASIFTTAAIPPLLFISAMRNSLNQTSPRTLSVWLFLIPTIKVLTKPKFGFPLIPKRKLTSPSPSGKELSSSG